jgi:hypothetical protein
VARKADGVGVVGIKKLPSGDIVVQTREREGRDRLVGRRAWIESVAPSAQVIPDLYPVRVHGIRVSRVNTANQKVAATALEEQNRVLHPGLAVLRVPWPRGLAKSGESFSTLIVFLTTPEAANRVIERGLVEGGEVKLAERFVVGCGLVQCFKCCGYGHIAKHCRIEARCGHCSGSHKTRACDQKEAALCANCKIKGRSTQDRTHKAWAEVCGIRIQARNELERKLRSAPWSYPCEVKPDQRPLVVVPQPKKRGRPAYSATAKTSVVTRAEDTGEEMDVVEEEEREDQPAKR